MQIEPNPLLSSQGDIQSVQVADNTDGTSHGVNLEVVGTLTPYILVNGDFQLSNQSVDVTDQLRVGFVQMPKNTQYTMAVLAFDAAGNGDYAYTDGRVP